MGLDSIPCRHVVSGTSSGSGFGGVLTRNVHPYQTHQTLLLGHLLLTSALEHFIARSTLSIRVLNAVQSNSRPC